MFPVSSPELEFHHKCLQSSKIVIGAHTIRWKSKPSSKTYSSQLKAWNQLEEKEASGVKENHSTRRAVCRQALMLTGEGGGRKDQVHGRQFFIFLQQVRAWESPSPRSLGWRWMRGRKRQPGSQYSCPMTLGAHALGGDLWGHVNTEPPILTPRPPSHLSYSFLCFTTYVYFLLVIRY